MLALVVLVLGHFDEIEQWGQWEMAWHGPLETTGDDLMNPFVDVQLHVELSSNAAGSTFTVRGFYDGDGQYRARFMPPTTGNWSYVTKSSAADLNGKRGVFTVRAAAGSNHGPIVAAPGQTKFAYADGAPFFAVATTVYGMFLNASRTLATLQTSPFNKVRTLLGTNESFYQTLQNDSSLLDPTRFNPRFFHSIESTLGAMREIGVEAELILFMHGWPLPARQGCLGGPDVHHYNTTLDELYIDYVVARLASFRNVWWSMSNEWSQLPCYWEAPTTNPCAPGQRDGSDPGCGYGGSNSPAWYTPIWDALFQRVATEDPSSPPRQLSIHNNEWLYNYSRPWVTHFSIQHTHNKPKDLWHLYGKKPFMYDEIKYEGRLSSNWGSLSAPQMAQRFWWAAAAGAYGMHGEMLYDCPYWSDSSGRYCGQSVDKIAWFKNYMLNTTLHPAFEECEGDDDGYVHTLTCGHDFLLFHFYSGHPNASSAFQYIYLPKNMSNRQDLLQPWEMISTLIYKPAAMGNASEDASTDTGTLAGAAIVARGAHPPPPGSHIFGPPRDTQYWEPVGITVDGDTLPHILTFTACSYEDACERDVMEPVPAPLRWKMEL